MSRIPSHRLYSPLCLVTALGLLLNPAFPIFPPSSPPTAQAKTADTAGGDR